MSRKILKYIIFTFGILFFIQVLVVPAYDETSTIYPFMAYIFWPAFALSTLITWLFPFFEIAINYKKYSMKAKLKIFCIDLFCPMMGTVFLYYKKIIE